MFASSRSCVIVVFWCFVCYAYELYNLAGRYALIWDQGTVTFKRRMAGLKVGRKTRGHKTHIFGVTELDTVTRKLTGKCYLREFNHYDTPTFKRIILSLAVPGPADDPTPIWGDMFPSYGFLHNEEHVEGFCYTPVNHIAGQLTTRSGASSNAAEWTVKTWRKQLADYNTRIPAKGDFGLHLSEMM